MKIGDVYLVNFHYEDNDRLAKLRPAVCILVNSDKNEIAALKITSKERTYDKYSVKLDDSKTAGLNFQSFARCNKIEFFKKSDVIAKLGSLSDRDLKSVIVAFSDYYSKLSELSQNISRYQRETIRQETEPELEME